MTERWKQIEWAQNYFVSDLGRVRANTRMGERILSQSLSGKGKYKTVSICVDGNTVNRRVHRLVLEAFVCQCPSGKQAAHLNGDKYDNRVENLAWLSSAENNRQRIEHGTMPRKFSVREVLKIRDCTTMSKRAMARRYGVSHSTISRIVNRVNYAEI